MSQDAIVQTNVKTTVYFTMVRNLDGKWMRVGNAYASAVTARSWVPFVRKSWRGLPTKVSACTLRFQNGELTERSRQVLSVKFNLEA